MKLKLLLISCLTISICSVSGAWANDYVGSEKCFECHFPKASKSTISVATYTGDVRTHIVKINTDPDANMFKEIEEDGKKTTFAKGFVTVEYTCLSCHASRDKAWASENATNYHGTN